jgi:hypothetical protein
MFKAKATRDAFIATLSGHAFPVVAGEIYEFPDVVQTEVILAGCIPVEESAPKAPELSAQDRHDAIYNACVELLSKKDIRQLGPEGFPKISNVKKLTGFEPTIEEIVAVCEELQKEV